MRAGRRDTPTWPSGGYAPDLAGFLLRRRRVFAAFKTALDTRDRCPPGAHRQHHHAKALRLGDVLLGCEGHLAPRGAS